MQPLQGILLYGHEELLLTTRSRILEGAGFRTSVTSESKEISGLVRGLPADLLLLCHSLSHRQCAAAGLIAKHHRPQVLTLLMADGCTRECDCGISDVVDELFFSSLQPKELVAKVRSMFEGRPPSRLMPFPERADASKPFRRTS